MTRSRKSWSRRRGRGAGERGAVAVEFALVFPLFLVLVFGVIEFGFIFNDSLSVTHGVREGGREGAVGNFGSSNSCGLVGASTSSSQATKLMCLTKNQINLNTPSKVRTKVCLDNGAHGCSSSVSNYGTLGGRIAVCAMYPVVSRTGLIPGLGNKALRARVVFKIEQLGSQLDGQVDNFVTTQETPLAGQNWNFCVPD